MQIKQTITGSEQVTLSDAKVYLKVDYTDEDTLITSLIKGIREQVELFTGLALVAKTVEYFDEEIPETIVLPFPEHLAIVEVKLNGSISTDYYKTGLSQFIITPQFSVASQGSEHGIYIKYTTTGYCPEGIKLEMLKILDDKYRNRGNTFEGSISELNENAYANLAKYCLM